MASAKCIALYSTPVIVELRLPEGFFCWFLRVVCITIVPPVFALLLLSLP
jgi:hypothetical protein